jgi:hypothetical protein
MNLVKEFNVSLFGNAYSFYSFAHRKLPNNTVNYYVNDDRALNVFDQDWNFLQRINFDNLNPYISLKGSIFVDCEFIYIGNPFIFLFGSLETMYVLKLDFDLNIINYHQLKPDQSNSIAFDWCNKRIFLLWTILYDESKIFIDVYNLYLRKISEINTTSIINNAINKNQRLPGIVFFNNKLYITYTGTNNYQYIMVTDINGQYITTHNLIQTSVASYMGSFTLDNFGNILYTSMGKLCLFDTVLNKTINCTQNEYLNEYKSTPDYFLWDNDYPLYSKLDQSGRLVTIDSFKHTIQLYY